MLRSYIGRRDEQSEICRIGLRSAFLQGHFDQPDVAASAIETLLSAKAEISDALHSIVLPEGQYGLVVIDSQTGTTHLIADWLGTTPIYYTHSNNRWLWSFRLKNMLSRLPVRTIDVAGLLETFLYRYLLAEHTLISQVQQVLPGQCVSLVDGESPISTIYHMFEFAPASLPIDWNSLADRTDCALDESLSFIKSRYPKIAILFSGGVDSSLLLAKARAHGFEKLIAVTARFLGHENPELSRALATSAHLGIEPLVVDISDDYISSHSADLVSDLERPPTYLNGWARKRIFEAISGQVDAALTGEGADCMFGSDEVVGLRRYDKRQRAFRFLTPKMRFAVARILKTIPNVIAERLAEQFEHSTLDVVRRGNSFEAGRKSQEIKMTDLVPTLKPICASGLPSLYECFEPKSATSPIAVAQNRSLYTSNRNQVISYAQYAAEFGIPVVHPFLGKEIMEIARTLPDAAKTDAKGAKPILKRLAMKHIPASTVYGRKYDFRPPVAAWLGSALAGWLDILHDDITLARGIFDPTVLSRCTVDHDRGLIVTAATLEIFFRNFLDGD